MNPNGEINEAKAEPAPPEETPATAKPAGYCRICGRPLAQNEVRTVGGVIYCAEHAPAANPPAASPPSPWETGIPPAETDVSPGLAFLLGLIPGVGAIYNGQYAKGLVHVVIFGLLISILGSGAAGMAPLFGMLLAGWCFYMPFEAYHTAKKRRRGEPVDEFSGFFQRERAENSLVAPVVLIATGVFFLLVNFGVIQLYQLVRFWPVLLIAIGGYMLYLRLSARNGVQAAGEAGHEH